MMKRKKKEAEERAKKLAENIKPKAISKAKLKKKLEEEILLAQREAEKTESDPTLKLQKKQEEAARVQERDLQLSAALLGFDPEEARRGENLSVQEAPGADFMSGIGAALPTDLQPSGISVESLNILSDTDLDKLNASLIKKVSELQTGSVQSKRLLKFITSLCKACSQIMRIDEIAELKRVVTTLHTDKTKTEQSKKGQKKPAAHVHKVNSGMRNVYDDGSTLDDANVDDFDFM